MGLGVCSHLAAGQQQLTCGSQRRRAHTDSNITPHHTSSTISWKVVQQYLVSTAAVYRYVQIYLFRKMQQEKSNSAGSTWKADLGNINLNGSWGRHALKQQE